MGNWIVRRRYRSGLLMLLFGLTAVALAACSGSEDAVATAVTVQPTATTVPNTATTVDPTATQLPPAPTQPAPTGTPVAVEDGLTVDVRPTGTFGDILIGPNGLTLYIFDRDTEGVSNCSGGCLNAWPPLLVDESETTVDGDVTAAAVPPHSARRRQGRSSGNKGPR